MKAIEAIFGANVKIVIPMGYPANNQAYISNVMNEATARFGVKNVRLLVDHIAFDKYLEILQSCDLAYFLFQRQQAIGTICLLIQFNIPFVLSERNSFIQDLSEQNIPVLRHGEHYTAAHITKIHQHLALLDKANISFFNPNYIEGWQLALSKAMED